MVNTVVIPSAVRAGVLRKLIQKLIQDNMTMSVQGRKSRIKYSGAFLYKVNFNTRVFHLPEEI